MTYHHDRNPRRLVLILAVSLTMATAAVLAQGAGGQDIQVRTDPTFGEYLVDSRGHTVYAYLGDSPFTSTCLDECAEVWQPVTFSGIVPSSAGVNTVLVGSAVRPDGTSQATYAGMPLYTYSGDTAEGSFEGVGVDEAWYPVAVDGTLLGRDGSGGDAAAGDAEPLTVEELMAQGREHFMTFCAACHEADGRGNIGPSLQSNQRLADAAFVARQIRDGGSEMPGFGGVLNEQQLAAVATYIRMSFGNNYEAMTPDQFRR